MDMLVLVAANVVADFAKPSMPFEDLPFEETWCPVAVAGPPVTVAARVRAARFPEEPSYPNDDRDVI